MKNGIKSLGANLPWVNAKAKFMFDETKGNIPWDECMKTAHFMWDRDKWLIDAIAKWDTSNHIIDIVLTNESYSGIGYILLDWLNLEDEDLFKITSLIDGCDSSQALVADALRAQDWGEGFIKLMCANYAKQRRAVYEGRSTKSFKVQG